MIFRSLIPLILGQLLKELQTSQNSPKTFNGNTSHNATMEVESMDFNILTNYRWRVWHDIYILATLLVGSTLCGCFINHHVDQRQKRMGAKMRIACCSLIQRKVRRLNDFTVFLFTLQYCSIFRLLNSH